MNTLIAITGLGIFCLLFEILNLRKAIVPITIIGLLGVLALNYYEFGSTASYYNNMITVSKFSVTFSSLFIVLTIFLVALSHNFYENHPTKISDFVAIKVFLLAGGVAANLRLRERLTQELQPRHIRLSYPAITFCTDNAAMIASAAFFHLQRGERHGVDLDVQPGLSLPFRR